MRFKSRIRHYRFPDRFPDIAASIYRCHKLIGDAISQRGTENVQRMIDDVDMRYFRLAKSWYRWVHFTRLRGLADRIAPLTVKSFTRKRQRAGAAYKLMRGKNIEA
jgi:hypothetical protein